jgi:hypothetical protein
MEGDDAGNRPPRGGNGAANLRHALANQQPREERRARKSETIKG